MTLADIERKIEALDPKSDDYVTEAAMREILDMLLEHIKELEERVDAPPIRQGKRP